MPETHILLVRHPETEANVSGRFVGRGDTPFTPTGRRQLRRVPRKIASFGPDIVWTSPLQRALRLGIAGAAKAACPLRVDERLVELDFGQAEGLTYDEVVAAGIPFDYQNAETPVAPGGESRAHIELRSAEFLDELLSVGGRHVIVTHGGVFRASLVHLLGLASSDIWAFHIRNAQMAHVHMGDGYGVLEEYRQG
jgi:broad specificity phosphatase PhoE